MISPFSLSLKMRQRQIIGLVAISLGYFINTFRQVGSVLGVAILGAALGNKPTTGSMQTAIEVLLVAFVLGLALSASALRRK